MQDPFETAEPAFVNSESVEPPFFASDLACRLRAPCRRRMKKFSKRFSNGLCVEKTPGLSPKVYGQDDDVDKYTRNSPLAVTELAIRFFEYTSIGICHAKRL
jgi:hypothetical protein